MKQKLYVIFFMVVVTTFFGGLVSLLYASLSNKISSNRIVQNQKVILKLLEIISNDSKLDNDYISEMYKNTVVCKEISINDTKEKVYLHNASNSKQKLAVFEFRGQGFWDKIEGFISINIMQRSIKEVIFTKHSETPGLGGRISEEKFLERFKGKKIDLPKIGNKRLFFVSEGTATKENEIDGITGASETTKAVDKIINNCIDKVNIILEKFGGNFL